jgi:hypothetical protein
MDPKMIMLTGKVRQALNTMTGIVGTGHVLYQYISEVHQTVNDMEKLHVELWELLKDETKPKEEKEEFREVK